MVVQGLHMVLSHLAFVPTALLALRYGYLIDLAFTVRTIVFSLVYHLDAYGFDLPGSVAGPQQLDHRGVWATLLWFYLRTMDMSVVMLVAVHICVSMLFDIFPEVLIDSWVFPVAMLVAALVVYAFRLVILEMPLPRLSATFTGLGLVFAALGMLCFYAGDYDRYHPYWHECMGLAGFFFYIAVLGFRVDKFFIDIDPAFDRALTRLERHLVRSAR